MVKLGQNMMEDHAGGNGDELPVGDRAMAIAEIDKLKMDSEFQKMMNDRGNPGQKAAVEKWLNLHRLAAQE